MTLSPFWGNKRIVSKARNGIFISASGSGVKTIFDCPRKVIRSFFDVLFVDYLTDFVFNNVDKKGDISKNEGALTALYDFGKKMNKILYINENMMYALLEPGVTFGQLKKCLDVVLWMKLRTC